MSEQTVESLGAEFGVEGVVRFAMRGGLVCAEVTTPGGATAAVAMQGAQVLEWRPGPEAREVLFLSRRSEFAEGKAVRGGIPVIWPWFGDRREVVNVAPEGAPKSGSHGFARTAVWRMEFAAVMGEEVHLALSLRPTRESRAMGFDGFRLLYRVVVGRELRAELLVANEGAEELRFEEALHSYFAVEDATRVRLRGLEGTEYLDKQDGMRRKREESAELQFERATDRVYVGTAATCEIEDGDRVIRVEKTHSRATVVWNPWTELTPGLKDMEPEGWREMVCVETANVWDEAVRLGPGEAKTMGLTISVVAAQEGGR